MAKAVSVHTFDEKTVHALGLLDVEIGLAEGPPNETESLFYSIGVTRPTNTPDGHCYFKCDVVCGRIMQDSDPTVSVRAAYACLLRGPIDDKEIALQTAQAVSRYAIWAKFTDLFGLVTSQMGIGFPPLPFDPGEIGIYDDGPSVDFSNTE